MNGLKAIKVIKNNDDAYGLEYWIVFDSNGRFSHPTGGICQIVIIFGADMSSSIHANNKKLILGEGITQIGITFYAEKMYSINFTKTNKTFCLSFHCNGDKNYLFVNGTEIIKFNEKTLKF